MSKTKKLSKVLAIVLALALLMSMSALAAWPTHQGDDNRDGRITDGAPTSAVPTTVIDSLQLPYNGNSLMSGIDTEPIMRTEGTTTYAYIVYNGGTVIGNTGGCRLAKIDCSSPNSSFMEGNTYVPEKRIAWNVQLTPAVGFQLCTPVMVGDTLYLGANGLGQLLANNELAMSGNTMSNWTVSTNATKCDGYVSVSGDQTVTLTSDAVVIDGSKSHRPALGIHLGASASTTVEANIAVAAIDVNNGNNVIPLCDYDFNTDNGTAAEFKPIQSQFDDEYYYYYNKNLTSEENALIPDGTYKFLYTVTITGNTNSTVTIDYASFYQQGSYLYEATSLGLTSPSIQPLSGTGAISGQMNTPLTYYSNGTNEYLYFGTYTGSRSYYEYNITGHTLTAFTPYKPNTTTKIGNFYWAGAAVVTVGSSDYVVFGSDAFTDSSVKHTYLYYREVGSFASSGGFYDLNTLGVTEAGNVRSTISKDSTYIYFTSQGPSDACYIWRVPIADIGGTLTSNNVSHIDLGNSVSTSTPAISTNGKIYVGIYNGFTTGGIKIIDSTSFTVIRTISSIGPVQSSVVVYTSGNYDYIYFTTNSNADYAYGYKCTCNPNNPSSISATRIWRTANTSYSLQGMGACNGILTYGNDSNRFYIVK